MSAYQHLSSSDTLNLLRRYESRNITYLADDGSWPLVWEKAKGVHVWDADGIKYLDLTAAFGVAATGHANPAVVRAGQKQMARLLHAMGDVHPHALKARLARELSRLTFERWSTRAKPNLRSSGRKCAPFFASDDQSRLAPTATGKTIFCNSGFEAVEAALKTALLATGKPGIIAFEGAYHGLGYGALNATHRQHFRAPFQSQLRHFGRFVRFPTSNEQLADIEKAIRRELRKRPIGAILVEPIQVRGGVNVPPPEFLPLLRRVCDQHRALLVLDEIYTGFGRTGAWFACEHWDTTPDLICLGKALTNGFPLSACVGRADLMDAAWPRSEGEAIHTSTFLGHPVGCAMALAQIRELEQRQLPGRAARVGRGLLKCLSCIEPPDGVVLSSRGMGLLAALEFRLKTKSGGPRRATEFVLQLLKDMLRRGFILLPEGEHSNILSFTPPLTISETQMASAVQALRGCMQVRTTGDAEHIAYPRSAP